MECSCFTNKAFTTVALLFFAYKMIDYTIDALDFFWSVEICTDEEDLGTSSEVSS